MSPSTLPLPTTPASTSPSTSTLPASNLPSVRSNGDTSPLHSNANPAGPSNHTTSQHDPLSPGRKRRKVTRSKSGCLTCRRRRKLCDMAKPQCGACVRLTLDCSWPEEDAIRPARRRSQPTAPSSHPQPAIPTLMTLPFLPQAATHTPSRSSSLGINHSDRAYARGTSVSGTMEDFVGIFGDVDGGMGHNMNGTTTFTDANTTTSDTGLIDWLAGGGSLDEATLQLWAADCLAVPTTQTFNAFDSLNSVLLQPTPPSNGNVDPPLTLASAELARSGSRSRSRNGSRRTSRSPTHRNDTPTGSSQTALLNYFHESLSRLVSCTGDAAPSAFEAFTKLANMTVGRGPAGQGLHLSILAWTGRHMVNRGLMKYEAVSEKFSAQATNLVNERMAHLFDGRGNERMAQGDESQDKDTEKMTLLAASLMLMQFKVGAGWVCSS
ncbi:hypothetical protein IAR55_003185 [Kwoniella newhampshirensis]|uniref:Zn(2)-C6 fungal-type domain-containing protein n=1 Tax=Kwoniella newhampshirensis TaxID=1651941 RepID=A0AAW0YPM9_9TREE